MVTVTLQAVVQNVWQLVALRALQGAFVGTIPAATALVAGGTPARRMAYALGFLQMGIFTSQTIGPVIGGLMADQFGFRPTFAIGGLMYIVSFALVFFFVQEDFHRPDESVERPGYVENLRSVMRVPAMLLLISVMFLVSTASVFVRPVVPLVVESFSGEDSAAAQAGLVFAALAITSAVAALFASRVADRSGYRNVLALATLGAGLAYIPVAIAESLLPLMVLMALVGIFSGAMVPTVNALIGATAPEGKHGSAFGLVGSAQALSFAIAPLLGGITARQLGIHAPFPIIGTVLVLVAVLIWLTVREPVWGAGEDAAPAGEPVADAAARRV
jgi:MFS family permease